MEEQFSVSDAQSREAAKRAIERAQMVKSEIAGTETQAAGDQTYQKAAANMAAGAGSGNVLGTLGAGAIAANPVVGAGLMTVGAISQANKEKEMQRYNEKVAKLNREQEALSAVQQLAQRFKAF